MSDQKRISGRDLLEAGVPAGRGFAEDLEYAREELSKGMNWSDIVKGMAGRLAIRRAGSGKLTLKGELPVAVAADPIGRGEEENIQGALLRIKELTRVPVVTAAALMPDTCPSGSEWGAIPVGGIVVTKNSVIPGAHSADVNCGMCASFFDSKDTISALMGALKKSTFFGPFPAPAGHESPSPVLLENVWSNPFLKGLEPDALRYLGTQGDGNHFSYLGEIDVSRQLVEHLGRIGHDRLSKELSAHRGRRLWTLVTHHGSRNFGAKVYKRGIVAAEIHTEKVAEGVPRNAAWIDLDTQEGRDYWAALEYVGRWTTENHETIHRKFLGAIGAGRVSTISNHHNAVWRREEGVYHGKGATPAWKSGGIPQLGIIPLNMGREILLVEGRDNLEFLSFAPHGAGRNKSRRATKEAFLDPSTGEINRDRVEQSLIEQTSGIEVSWASGVPDISESPLGYKPASTVRAQIEKFQLASIISEVRPRGCIMAGEFRREERKAPRTLPLALGREPRGGTSKRDDCLGRGR